MRKQYIHIIDIVLTKMYDTMEYVTVSDEFMKENGVILTERISLCQLYNILIQTGFVEVPSGLQDEYFQCKITNEGLLMMLTYGSYKNYLKYIRAKCRSNKLMFVFVVVVAVCTILSSLANVIVAMCRPS